MQVFGEILIINCTKYLYWSPEWKIKAILWEFYTVVYITLPVSSSSCVQTFLKPVKPDVEGSVPGTVLEEVLLLKVNQYIQPLERVHSLSRNITWWSWDQHLYIQIWTGRIAGKIQAPILWRPRYTVNYQNNAQPFVILFLPVDFQSWPQTLSHPIKTTPAPLLHQPPGHHLPHNADARLKAKITCTTTTALNLVTSWTRETHNKSVEAPGVRALAIRVSFVYRFSARTEAPRPGDAVRYLLANPNTTNTVYPTSVRCAAIKTRGDEAQESLAYLEEGSTRSSHFHD